MNVRSSTGRAGTSRALVVLAVALVTLVAGCRGARRGTPAAPVAPSGTADTAKAPVRSDSADAKAPVADSAAAKRTADSLAKVAVADSTKADSARKKPTKKPAPASRPCVLDMTESPPETRLLYSRINENVSNTFVGGGFVGRCQGENNRLRASGRRHCEPVRQRGLRRAE